MRENGSCSRISRPITGEASSFLANRAANSAMGGFDMLDALRTEFTHPLEEAGIYST